ncbi:MAG TPA: c-type cytochrome [Gammaproteobacteria bacterium]|nr:c-type cytochrome [Gammaproteobacteria bacterium]
MPIYDKISFPLYTLILVSSLFICTQTQAETSTATTNPALIYHNYCSVCHGDKGDGNSHAESSMVPPPANFTLQQTARRLTRESMIHSVTKGRPGTAMAAWEDQLSPKEIKEVVDYVREFFMPPVGAGDISRGKKFYAQNCSVCHGDHGQSAKWGSNLLRSRPRNFTTEASRRELSRERMINSVTHGVPGTPMAAFGVQLNAGEIADIVDYIRKVFMHSRTPSGISGTHAYGAPATEKSANFSDMGVVNRRLLPKNENAPLKKPVDMSAGLPDNLQGDPQIGHAMYIQNCVQCHGIKGNGEGPRAYFIFPRPRDFTRESSRKRFNRPALYHSISKGKLGTEMPAWDLAMTPQQIADISEYVFQTFIRADTAKQTQKK